MNLSRLLIMADSPESPLIIDRRAGLLILTLNRPRVLNTLNLDMIRRLRQALDEARTAAAVRLVLLAGAGERGLCAGGDLKELTQAVRDGDVPRADRFFREEYDLDLLIHRFPKPVIVLAHGITMGGGLGLAAGADCVIATETTRMAMPETRIGFFPDVGATGWLFRKCPRGYPEYLALTGHELLGAECVRLGLATHLVPAARLPALREALHRRAGELPTAKPEAVAAVGRWLAPFTVRELPANPALDAWVAHAFAGKQSLAAIQAALKGRGPEAGWGAEVRSRLAERSPTALAVTLQLLRANEGRPLPEVLQREALAAHFLISHPDYLEGIRARIVDKDDQPCWQPPAGAAAAP